MYRYTMEELKKWKEKKNKKPLIIKGARQVGKTWLMKEFATTFYQDYIYINFENNTRMKQLFDADLEVKNLILGIELYARKKIDISNTLIIFDEIQEVPRAITSLKYFCENENQYHVVCAGSHLGVTLHKNTSFPVGKVEFIELYPLTFFEFAQALGETQYIDLLKDKNYHLVSTFKDEYINLLKQYYLVGGMPEVVDKFIQNKDYEEMKKIQKNILMSYEYDFSKYPPVEIIPKIRMLFHSIPNQLAKDNKKFIYSLVKEGARSKDYETAMLWLSDSGITHKLPKITTPMLPLRAYEDLKSFKLFFIDIGLLSCMVNLDPKVILDKNDIFKEFKGALTEQYVMQQLKTINGIQGFYWSEAKSTAEIDFILEYRDLIIPTEVKAETNLKSKSLKIYKEKFNPLISFRISMADYKKEEWLTNLPLYAIEIIKNEIN